MKYEIIVCGLLYVVLLWFLQVVPCWVGYCWPWLHISPSILWPCLLLHSYSSCRWESELRLMQIHCSDGQNETSLSLSVSFRGYISQWTWGGVVSGSSLFSMRSYMWAVWWWSLECLSSSWAPGNSSLLSMDSCQSAVIRHTLYFQIHI